MTDLPLFDDRSKARVNVREDANVQSVEHRAGIVRNSALWSAYGDALGWISELTNEKGLKRRMASAPLTRPVEWKRRIGGRTGVTIALPRGCYSDDSQLRLATARAIQSRGFDVESFAKVELPVWLSYALGAGRSTSAAATNLTRRKVQWFSNTFKGWTDSGGNGAAMRIQPHVWATPDPGDLTAFIPDVIRNSICTHSHPRGMLGATFHALALAQTIATRRYPTPNEMAAAIDFAKELPMIMSREVDEWSFWRSAYGRSSGPFEDHWARAIDECQRAIRIAGKSEGDSGTDRYQSIVERLRLYDQDRRGDGTLTAVAAMGLVWCEENPEESLRIAANAVGTDTDTIATMAGAVLGAVADGEPPVEVLDVKLFRSEASRLAAISSGAGAKDHLYPDLLHWSAPKKRADSLVELDGNGIYVRGFGRAEPRSGAFPGSYGEFSWQWVKLRNGQTLLIKRRHNLPRLHAADRGLLDSHVFQENISSPADPKGAEKESRRHTDKPIEKSPGRTIEPPQSRRRSSRPDVQVMIDYLERHQYDDRIVGQALRRVVNKCNAGELAAFMSVLIERLRNSPRSDRRRK